MSRDRWKSFLSTLRLWVCDWSTMTDAGCFVVHNLRCSKTTFEGARTLFAADCLQKTRGFDPMAFQVTKQAYLEFFLSFFWSLLISKHRNVLFTCQCCSLQVEANSSDFPMIPRLITRELPDWGETWINFKLFGHWATQCIVVSLRNVIFNRARLEQNGKIDFLHFHWNTIGHRPSS